MNTENKENQEEKKSDKQFQRVKTVIIDLGKIKQTKAFARQDGAILGIVWIASFVCTMLAADPSYQMLGLISNLLIISTPFVVAKRLKAFRDNVREGIFPSDMGSTIVSRHSFMPHCYSPSCSIFGLDL